MKVNKWKDYSIIKSKYFAGYKFFILLIILLCKKKYNILTTFFF